MRVTVFDLLLTTQTEPRAATSSFGSSPTGICATTSNVSGSTRVTVSSWRLETQTPPKPSVTPRAPSPVLSGVALDLGGGDVDLRQRPVAEVRDPDLGADVDADRVVADADRVADASAACARSIRCTVSSPVFATQASCTPSEMPCASLPIGIVAVGCSVGSVWSALELARSTASTTQTVPLPAAIWSGFSPTSTGSPTTCVAVGVDLAQRPVLGVGDEDALAVGGDAVGAVADVDRVARPGPAPARRAASAVAAGGCDGSLRSPSSLTGLPPPGAPSAATASAATSRHGSATSSAMRRRRGQLAGPARPRLGRRAGEERRRPGRRPAWGAAERPAGGGVRGAGCRARAGLLGGLAGGDAAHRRGRDLALQRGPGGAREVAGRRVALGRVLRHRRADHDVEAGRACRAARAGSRRAPGRSGARTSSPARSRAGTGRGR